MISTYKVHPKEDLYFTIKLLVSIILYPLLGNAINNTLSSDDPRLKATSICKLQKEFITNNRPSYGN
jgi:hypothetical protein